MARGSWVAFVVIVTLPCRLVDMIRYLFSAYTRFLSSVYDTKIPFLFCHEVGDADCLPQ